MPNGLVAVAARLAASASAAAGPAPADDAGVAADANVMDPLDYAIASKKLDDPLTAALQAKTEIMTAAAAAAAARARSGRSRSRSRRIRCNKDDEDQDRCSEFGSSRFVPTAPRRSSSSLETLELSNSSETGLTGAAAGQPGLLPPQGLAGAAPAQGLGRGGGKGLGKGNWVRSEEQKMRLRTIGKAAARLRAGAAAEEINKQQPLQNPRHINALVELVCAFKLPWTVGGCQTAAVASAIGKFLGDVEGVDDAVACIGDLFDERVLRESRYHLAAAYLYFQNAWYTDAMSRLAPLVGPNSPATVFESNALVDATTLRVTLWMWDETQQTASISGHSGTAVLGFPVSAEYINAWRRGEDVSGIAVSSMLQYGRTRICIWDSHHNRWEPRHCAELTAPATRLDGMAAEVLLPTLQKHCPPMSRLPPLPRVSLSDVLILLGDGASNNTKLKRYTVNARALCLSFFSFVRLTTSTSAAMISCANYLELRQRHLQV